MTIYKATLKLITKMMIGHIHSRAFVVRSINDVQTIQENVTPGDPGVSANIGGSKFADLIDSDSFATGAYAFKMPAGMAPPYESLLGWVKSLNQVVSQPVVRCEVAATEIGLRSGRDLLGRFFMNRYFEADIPDNTHGAWLRTMVGDGWIALPSVALSGVPPAYNSLLPALVDPGLET